MLKWLKSLFFKKRIVSREVELIQDYLINSRLYSYLNEDLLMITTTYSDGSKRFEKFLGRNFWRTFPDLTECSWRISLNLSDLREKEVLKKKLQDQNLL
jgi:hypothetical protein